LNQKVILIKRKMKQLTVILLWAVLIGLSCKDQNQNSGSEDSTPVKSVVDAPAARQIDSVLKSFIDNGQLAGVSALVYENDEEVYYNAFGYADREAGVPMDRNTIVQIYSMTKPITGVALMTLYEDGAFEMDDPLSKYLPEYGNTKVYTGVDTDGNLILEDPNRPITVRDIARHTAGFPNRGNIPGLSEKLRQADVMNREHELAEMSAKLASVPLWFHPGEQWEYGPSVDVQAYLVEKLAGLPFEEYVRANVLDPLGMEETRYMVPEEDRDRFSAMYRKVDDSLHQLAVEESKSDYLQEWPLRRGGSGLTSTLDDYMRFARMLQNKGNLEGDTILKPETVKLMATNQLADSVTERNFLPSKGSVGFGIDFAVRMAPPASPDENYGVPGEFFWDGAASTLFWVDPENQLTAVLFVQHFPYDPIGLHKSFRAAVYSSYKKKKQEP
jgi:CubicO group peptidase (beta-lactamase class C family)